ncbi:MAG: isochorismatase family protein [Bacterioplanes sp.]|nr:isochorismatase family protein [Bacterioplanes sp.]
MLSQQTTGLMIVDVQGTLSDQIDGASALFERLKVLIQVASLMELPIIWMEQVPDKLGHTRPEIAELLPGDAFVKTTFSGMKEPAIAQAVKSLKMTQWLVAGLETHVCVYQTVCDLLKQKYEVHLVTDCVGSRVADNKALAVAKMDRLGAQLTSLEMAVFELQQKAEGDVFRQMIRLIK